MDIVGGVVVVEIINNSIVIIICVINNNDAIMYKLNYMINKIISVLVVVNIIKCIYNFRIISICMSVAIVIIIIEILFIMSINYSLCGCYLL